MTGYGIDGGLALLPAKMDTKEARVMLLAIGGQESNLQDRRQIAGPARGLWQFERGGGTHGVLVHPATAVLATKVCTARNVKPDAAIVWAEFEHDDILAAAFARLLLWTDPRPLPEIGDQEGAWRLYLRTWRPGKPHPDRWPGNYRNALEELQCY